MLLSGGEGPDRQPRLTPRLKRLAGQCNDGGRRASPAAPDFEMTACPGCAKAWCEILLM